MVTRSILPADEIYHDPGRVIFQIVSQFCLSANDKPRQGQHRQVDQVDKERADDRHDDKGSGNGPWRRVNACMLAIAVAVAAIAKAAEGSRNDRALIVAPD
jgi:hypothetical protein